MMSLAYLRRKLWRRQLGVAAKGFVHRPHRRPHASSGRCLRRPRPQRREARDLPGVQSTKFEFVINLKAIKVLGIGVPPGVLSIADEVRLDL